MSTYASMLVKVGNRAYLVMGILFCQTFHKTQTFLVIKHNKYDSYRVLIKFYSRII